MHTGVFNGWIVIDLGAGQVTDETQHISSSSCFKPSFISNKTILAAIKLSLTFVRWFCQKQQ